MDQNLNLAISNLPEGEDATAEAQLEREALQKEHEDQIKLLKESLFNKPEVPNWMIDDISFAVMHDPVMVSFALLKISLLPQATSSCLEFYKN